MRNERAANMATRRKGRTTGTVWDWRKGEGRKVEVERALMTVCVLKLTKILDART